MTTSPEQIMKSPEQELQNPHYGDKTVNIYGSSYSNFTSPEMEITETYAIPASPEDYIHSPSLNKTLFNNSTSPEAVVKTPSPETVVKTPSPVIEEEDN